MTQKQYLYIGAGHETAEPLAGLHTNMRVCQAGCATIPTTKLILIVDLNWIFSSSERRHAQSMHAHQERRYLR